MSRKNLTNRVVGSVDYNHLRAGGDSTSLQESQEQVYATPQRLPEFIKVNGPVITGRPGFRSSWGVQGDIHRLSPLKSHGGIILIEEGLEHDNFISGFQKRREDGVLTYVRSIVLVCQAGQALWRIAFVCTTRHENFSIGVEITVELGTVEVFDRISQAESTFGMCIMIGWDVSQCRLCGLDNPCRRSEVHVSLPKIDASRGEISSAGYRSDSVWNRL
jgi:hypothetical protein